MTRTRPSAVPRSFMREAAGRGAAGRGTETRSGFRVPVGRRQGIGRAALAAAAAEEAEEIAIRRQDERRVLPAQRLAIGLHRAIKGEEVLILAERIGIDLDRLALALAAQDLRLFLRLGDDHRPLALGDRADTLGELVALGAEFLRLALPLGLHAREDRLAVLLGQVGAAQPHVDDLDA